jgi:2-polyprenyl-3-methyl-5-hydroxy-6-metoxy-1,4-benzoquinol methylase
MNEKSHDKSNGYEEIAEHFMRARNPRIGPSNVRKWCRTLAPGSSILDLGCGNGVPISQVLVEEGLDIYGVDASAKMVEVFRERFPSAHAQCCAVEDSDFFGLTFDGVIAWGLMFLLSPDIQPLVIHKVANVLNRNGKFLFTTPEQAIIWNDSLTRRESISLGAERYRQLLRAAGFVLVGEESDEGDNHYYLASKP